MYPEKSVARIPSILFTAFMAVVLTACGGGGGGGGGGGPTTLGVGGGGVKGPLANAIVTAYAFDATAAGFKGAVIDTGSTDASAKITGLALTLPLAPPYILEFTSDSGTTDITTGLVPVITTMRTVLTQDLLDNGEDVYATPLTTMATDLAVANADSNVAPFTGDASGTVSSAEFVAALPIAASQVASTLGFGVDSAIDIFDTPPLVDDTTDTTEEQTNVAAYRAAVEAVTAVVYEMDQQSSGTSPDSVLADLASDLADGAIDGSIDGVSTVYAVETLDVLEQDPATLPIPNSDDGTGNPILVGDVEQVLIDETATTGTTTDTAELDPTTGSIDTVVEPAETNPDIDGDGTLNANDAFPTDATEDTDTDGDGTGNNADADDDNDGVADGADAFALDATEHVDTDGDGTGNNADTDDDGDGTPDVSDDFPLDSSKQNATDVDNDGWPTGQDLNDADDQIPGAGTPFTDTDGDGQADSGGAADDADDDNDGVDDASDCAPLDATQNVDTDGDTICDVTDTDDDGDGTADATDAFPLDNTETTDTDGDGIGNNTDTDDDNDGVSDTQEGIDGTDPLLRDTDSDGYFDGSDAFPTDGTEHVDTDGDTTGNNADTDDDNDGVSDVQEALDGTKPLVADTDGDTLSDGAEASGGTNPLLADTDTDGTNDNTDNCPIVANADQLDTDGDTGGNACDTDDDNDNVSDVDEATAGTNPLLADTDGDSVNDDTDVFPLDATESADTDSDTVGDNADNCPADANTDQLNTDGDAEGNVCDADDDADTVLDGADNCPLTSNIAQTDSDGNGIGDACDFDDDGDGFSNTLDNCPSIANADQLNTDGDSEGNVCDADDDNDNVTDADEATAGTNPLLADTDSDGVNDDVDVFPTDGTETVDADSDGVGDNADNCPANANADQLNTDGDADGNVCDTDDDNDGVSDIDEATAGTNPLLVDTDGDGVNDDVDAFPTDGAESADTDSDTVGDNADNCPTVANTDQADVDTDGVGDICEATGIWKTTSTVTGLTPLGGDNCTGHDPISTVSDLYMTMTQTGGTLTAKTAWGHSLTGTVNGGGVFTLTGGSTSTDPFTLDMETETISVSGTSTSTTIWTGTVSITSAYTASGGSSVDQCTETADLSSAFVYKHVAGEDYDGVYGLELADEDGRSSFAVEFDITGSTMSLRLPFNDPNETITNTSFDPDTGFFSFDLDGMENYEDGVGSEEWHDKLTGILVRAPDEATLPTVVLNIDGYWAEYNAFGGSTGGGTMTSNGQDGESGYGKRRSSTGFTRGNYYRKNSDGENYEAIVMGMSHPPMKRATATSELYVEVLDGSTRLCTGLYSSKYTNAHYKPAVDMTAEEFPVQWHSFVSCNTSTNSGGISTHNVTDGMGYTVRIMDTGADGAVDGGDDTAVTGASMTVTAEVNPDVFAEKPSANTFALNGAAASKTMTRGNESGLIHLFGFFDVNEDMNFSWTGVAGAEKYSLQMAEWTDAIEQVRFPIDTSAVTGASDGTETEVVTLGAGTLDMWDGNVFRVRARKDGTDENHRSMATSKWIQINPGIQGLFNVEFDFEHFQVYLEGDMGNGTNAGLSACTIVNNDQWVCNSGAIDYTNNAINLDLDNVGGVGAVSAVFTFSDSANATITGGTLVTALSLTPAETHMRLANPELVIRSLQPSGGVSQQTQAILTNTMAAGALASGNMFDKSVFKRDDNGDLLVGTTANVGTTGKAFWNDIVADGAPLPFLTKAAAFVPLNSMDGVAAKVGHYIANRTQSEWGLGFGLLDGAGGAGVKYKSVWTNSSDGSIKWVFKKTYNEPDASVLVTPVHNQVTVNLMAGDVAVGTGVGDVGNPIDVTAEPTFGGLTWTGSVPAGGQWNIRLLINGVLDARTDWMDATHPDLTDNGDGTWTWVNASATGFALEPGQTVAIQIRASEGSNFTMLGAQRTGGIDDRIYLYIP